MLTVLSVMLRTAVEWNVIERIPCSIRLLKTSKSVATFYDFDEYERLVEAARSDPRAYLVALLGGEAGVRCGEMILEWPLVKGSSAGEDCRLSKRLSWRVSSR